MEAIILIGLQASGKSTFYKTYFSHTHTYINLDTLHTRNKEKLLLTECIAEKKSFVVDNTNPTKEQRSIYIRAAKEQGYLIKGYYLQSTIADCIIRNQIRNQTRKKKEQIPDKAILATSSKLELPQLEEGFDKLYYVKIDFQEKFIIENWRENNCEF